MRTDTYDPELKPCPFCGGEAYFERLGDRRQSCIVACTDCGASHESNDEGSMCGESWNRRSPPASAQSVECQHRIADARNPVVKSGYICVDCGALFSAADHSGESAQSDHYADAFYKIAEVLRLSAQDKSPEAVFNTFMLPMLRQLMAKSNSAQSVEHKQECKTCGGSKVDPGGLGYCRSCKQQSVEPVALADAIIREMCELCDRTSPEDEPDAMVANPQEMHGCVERAFETLGVITTQPNAADVRDAALEEVAQEIERTPGRLLSADAIRSLKSKKGA